MTLSFRMFFVYTFFVTLQAVQIVGSDFGGRRDEIPNCHVVADIILVIDSSTGVGISNFNNILQFSVELSVKLKFRKSDARFGAVVFSGRTEKLFDVQDNMTDTSMRQVLLKAPFLNEGRQTAAALHYVLATGMLNSTMEAGRAAKQFVIVFLGGPSDQTELTIASAKLLKDLNVTIIAVSVGDRIDPELPKLTSCPTDVFSLQGKDSLTHLERHLIQRACEGKPS